MASLWSKHLSLIQVHTLRPLQTFSLFYFFQTFKKAQHLSHQSTEYFPKGNYFLKQGRVGSDSFFPLINEIIV